MYCLKYCEEVQVWYLPWSQSSLTPLCTQVLVCLLSQLLPKPPIWLLNSLLLSVTAWCCQLYPLYDTGSLSQVGLCLTLFCIHSRDPVIFQMEVSRFCPVFSVMCWKVRRVRGAGRRHKYVSTGNFGTNTTVFFSQFCLKTSSVDHQMFKLNHMGQLRARERNCLLQEGIQTIVSGRTGLGSRPLDPSLNALSSIPCVTWR